MWRNMNRASRGKVFDFALTTLQIDFRMTLLPSCFVPKDEFYRPFYI